MRYRFSEIVDLQPISELLGYFHKATGVRCDVFELDGTPLTVSDWENLCIDFHRKNAHTSRRCLESDTSLVNTLLHDRKYAIYRCRNGVMDAAARVMVGGVHIANVLAGQIFCEAPDLEWFKEQAREFGFDEIPYLQAVSRVPVIPMERLETVLEYLSRLAELLGELGLRHLKQLEAEEALRSSERKYRNIFENAVEGIFQADRDRQYAGVNPALAQMHGYGTPEEMLADTPSMASHLFRDGEDRRRFFALLEKQGLVKAFESRTRTRDGREIWVSVNARTTEDENGRTLYEGTVENVTERKRAEQGMLVVQGRLETLSRGLLKKMETERHHIAHELHDEVGQALTVVKMSLEAVKDLPTRSELDGRIGESIGVVDRALSQVRRLSVNLRPAVLDDLGLVAALRWLVSSMIAKSGLEIRVDADDDAGRHLSKGIATACFRVAQEAVTNVLRHAEASCLTVGLRRQGDRLELEVSDDGVGFDAKKAQQRVVHGDSFGLLGMQERVTLSGGTLRIESTPGKGSVVTACFPYVKEQDNP